MNRTTNSMRALIGMSALSHHEELISKCVNVDDGYIDDDWLNEWNWSDGEKVLLNVLRVLARGHGIARIDDLFKLDQENREAAVTALRIRLGLIDDFGGSVIE